MSDSQNTYQDFFTRIHPTVKAENPTWTPQQVTTEIGRRWSLQKMTIEAEDQNIYVRYSKNKYVIDACNVHNSLIHYLQAYRTKHGDEAFLKLAESLAV
jgi:hypothetical protein